MSLIIALLSANTILHGVVIARFGMRDHNQPFLVFALVYAALALLAYLSVPYALWAVLVMSLVGIVGLTVTFNKPARDKTMDKAIWVLDAITISYAAYLLFAAKS
jgi:hypothetical protein